MTPERPRNFASIVERPTLKLAGRFVDCGGSSPGRSLTAKEIAKLAPSPIPQERRKNPSAEIRPDFDVPVSRSRSR